MTLAKNLIKKIPSLKLVILLEYQIMKNFLQKFTLQVILEVFVIKKVKNTVPWTYVINDLNREEILETLYENELQKNNQEEFRIKKVIKKKGDKFYVKWKRYNNSLNSWIDKKDII